MCGIFGMLGGEPVAPVILAGLKRLEYRGYDSAGVATIEGQKLTRLCAAGKLTNLEAKLSLSPLAGRVGIGHTRWATHGKPTEDNAHPHATEKVAVVHNGIIENFRELRQELESSGVMFRSETDTETIAHLVTEQLNRGLSPRDSVAAVLPRLRGTFALTFLFNDCPHMLIAARRGSPLVLGYANDRMLVGSDAIALAPYCETITYLEDGDWAIIQRRGAEVLSSSHERVERQTAKAPSSAAQITKGGYRHFMEKEIHEQPDVVRHTLSQYLDLGAGRVRDDLALDFSKVRRLSISACGTAFHAGLVAKYWFERFARLPVEIDIASEFRYREAPLFEGDISLFISQSGETADTLASLRYAKQEKQQVLSVVNVPTSTIARESDRALPTLAGPEIGVASTKAFTCQLAALACLAIAAGKTRGFIDEQDEQSLVAELAGLPRLICEVLDHEKEAETIAHKVAEKPYALYLGRGHSFPMALEGALKLKEISYIHAEGYAAGELKHGPIALVQDDLPVIVIAPRDGVFEKTISNVHEVIARSGKIILFSDAEGIAQVGSEPFLSFAMPDVPLHFAPIVYAIPLQMLAYHAALKLGKDIDQPRNLAKSVTVE